MAGVDALLDFDDAPTSVNGISYVGTGDVVHDLHHSHVQDPFGDADFMDDFMVSVAITFGFT